MTRTEKLLTIFPNAYLGAGYPDICPWEMLVGYREEASCRKIACVACKREFWDSEYQETEKAGQ